MTTLHAQPYNLDAIGFYFESLGDFETRFENARDSFGLPVEEFEIQFIDGDEGDAQLFEAAGINQATVSQIFDVIEDMDDYQKPALFFLLEQGYGLDEALEKIDDVMIQEGDLEEAAEQLFDEIYLHQIPENLHSYIDYKAFARDCEFSGDFREFEFAGTTYTCTNVSGI